MLSRDDIFNELGIGPVWRLRDARARRLVILTPLPSRVGNSSPTRWRIAPPAKLHSSRTRVCFGWGIANADWLIIGEAPGADEDEQGEPFVARRPVARRHAGRHWIGARQQCLHYQRAECARPATAIPNLTSWLLAGLICQAQIAFIQPKSFLRWGTLLHKVCSTQKRRLVTCADRCIGFRACR